MLKYNEFNNIITESILDSYQRAIQNIKNKIALVDNKMKLSKDENNKDNLKQLKEKLKIKLENVNTKYLHLKEKIALQDKKK